MFTTKTYYVIANKNGEFFSYDKMTGGYPYFGKYHESAEHFQTAEKAEEFLLHSNYTTNQFHDTFAKCSVILACVSKLSTTLNNFAYSGV